VVFAVCDWFGRDAADFVWDGTDGGGAVGVVAAAGEVLHVCVEEGLGCFVGDVADVAGFDLWDWEACVGASSV